MFICFTLLLQACIRRWRTQRPSELWGYLNIHQLQCGRVLFCIALSCGTAFSLAAEKADYKDIYLFGNGVCKACQVEWVDKAHVRLVNRAGMVAIVPVKAVIGIDRHPFMRKALLTSLHGIGLPGPLIVPAAFEDANDYVCKYCDSFNR